MSMLQSIMSDFGRRAGGPVPQCAADGTVNFLCDNRYSVTLFEDVAGCVHAMGLAGYLPPQHPGHDEGVWEPLDEEPREFDCSKHWHTGSGAMVVWAKAPGDALDSVAFSAWLEQFLDELTHAGQDLASHADERSAQVEHGAGERFAGEAITEGWFV